MAGISIGMLSGDNSILRQAGNAKTQTDIAQEKEILQIATLAAIGKHKYGDVTKEKLDDELDKNIGSTNYSSESVNNGISVTFTKSGRIYIVDKDGNIEQVPEAIGIASLSAEKTSISVGETTQLSAILEPTKSFGKITYSSADTSIATVSSSGLVTGIANGTVVITANVKGEEKNITIIVEKKLTAAELNGDLLGKEVDYSGYTASYSGGWRVFYATDEETFIITTSYIDATNAFGESGHIPLKSKSGVIYTGSFDVANSEYGKNWNKMWVIDQINQTTDKVNNENPESVQGQHRHKATAYLCDTANWTDYVTPNANYAVGGPTVELFVKSWENRPGGSSIQITGITNYGYPSLINSGIQETILQKNGVGLYNIGANYWIASPVSNDESRFSSYMSVCEIAGRFNGYNNNSSSCGVRPIVSIPTSKIRENSDGTKLVILP